MAELDWATIRTRALDGFACAALPPTLELPALPTAVTLFVQKSNDPKAGVRELAQIIETDSGLTLELLRHVEQPLVALRAFRQADRRQKLGLGMLVTEIKKAGGRLVDDPPLLARVVDQDRHLALRIERQVLLRARTVVTDGWPAPPGAPARPPACGPLGQKSKS